MPLPSYTTTQFPTGHTEPWGICKDANGHIWSCDFADGVLLKIDAATQTILDTITLANCNQCCYDAGTNTIWATYTPVATRLVAKIDATSDAVIGSYAVGAGLSALVSDGTRIWIGNHNDNTVTVLLAADGSLVATVGTGNGPNGIAFDGTHVWTANQSGNSVTKITAATQAVVGTYTVGNQPIGIAWDTTNIWVTDGGYTPTFLQSLERIDASTGSVLNTYPLGDDGTADFFAGMAWDATQGVLWMLDGFGGGGNNFIYAIDVSNGTIIATYDAYPSGSPILAVVTDADEVWVSNNNFGFLTILTPATPPVTGCFPGWLVINEPGTLSPFTPNTWTDQSHRLHTSESITFSWIARQRGTAKVPLIIEGDDDYMPTIGSQVCLWDITESGNFEVFSGTIDDFEVKWLGGGGARIVTLTCVSLEQVFDTIRLPNLLFTDQTCGDIFTALFAYASGCPVTLGTVDAGATLANFQLADFPTIADAFTRLATFSQYVWGVDPATGTLYFTPPNVTPSPFTLNSEDVLFEQFSLKEERHDYRNRQIVKINDNVTVQSSELFEGAGQQSFTMLRPIQQITQAWLTQNTQNHASGTFSGQPANGDTVSINFPTAGTGYNWSAHGTYAVGAIIVDSNGFVQKVVTSAGVTGATEPAWIEILHQITQDNLVQWENQGAAGFANGELAVYRFVTALDNTAFGDVLIGASVADTVQNLVDAINAKQDKAGVTFSLPTWENPLVNAEVTSGTVLTVRNKPAGQGFIAGLSDTSANFSWSGSVTSGGVTTFGTNTITFGVAGQTTGGNIFTIVYTPGSDVVQSATPLEPGNRLQIQYQASNAGYIQVEDTAQVIERAAIEGGTGKYQQTSSDDQSATLPQALQLAQQQLAAYGVIPQTFEFTTMKAGLYVGQVLAISLTRPDNAPVLINASWFIQEIQAEVVPVYGEDGASDRFLPGGGHFRYTVRCIDVAQIGDWIDFWLGLLGGGSSSGSFSGSGALGNTGSGSSSGGVNEQTVDYTALSTDAGKIIAMNPSGSPLVSLTLTLPATPPSTTWAIFVQDIGLADVVIDPGSLNIDGVAATLTLLPAQGVYISTDGINYFTSRGIGSSGTVKKYSVTFTAVSSLTVTHGLGTVDVSVSVYDSSGNLIIPGSVQVTGANTVDINFGIATTGYVVVLG